MKNKQYSGIKNSPEKEFNEDDICDFWGEKAVVALEAKAPDKCDSIANENLKKKYHDSVVRVEKAIDKLFRILTITKELIPVSMTKSERVAFNESIDHLCKYIMNLKMVNEAIKDMFIRL